MTYLFRSALCAVAVLLLCAAPASALSPTLTSPAEGTTIHATGTPTHDNRYLVNLSFAATWDPEGSPLGLHVSASPSSTLDFYGELAEPVAGWEVFTSLRQQAPGHWIGSTTAFMAPGVHYVQASGGDCSDKNPAYTPGFPDSCALPSKLVAINVQAPPAVTEAPPEGDAPQHSAPAKRKARGFKRATRKQKKLLRAVWRRSAGLGVGPASEVLGFYVTKGARTTNRFATGCVDRPGYTAVFGRVLRKVAGKKGRWKMVSGFNTGNVDADGEDRTAEDIIPNAAYERLQNAIRECARGQGLPYFYPGAEDQADDDE
jgi:hypothetical protein